MKITNIATAIMTVAVISIAPTMRVAVGALTPSAAATSTSRARPMRSIVASADSCDCVNPVVSDNRTLRARRIARPMSPVHTPAQRP